MIVIKTNPNTATVAETSGANHSCALAKAVVLQVLLAKVLIYVEKIVRAVVPSGVSKQAGWTLYDDPLIITDRLVIPGGGHRSK